MVKKLFLLLLFLSFLVSKTDAQHFSSKSISFENTNRYNIFYVFADSLIDTLKSVVLRESIIKESSPVVVVVMEEIGLGTLMGGLFSLPCGLIASKMSGEDGWVGVAAGVEGMFVGLLVGYSYGVYLTANSENRNGSFLGTFTSEIIGVGIGFGINIATNHKGIGCWTPIILPLSFPIIYSELCK